MSKKHRARKALPATQPSRRPDAEFSRAMNAVRSYYSNAVAWGTNLLTDARDEYSLDDVSAARLYAVSVTAWACANFRAGVESGIPPQVVDASGAVVGIDDNPVAWFVENAIDLLFHISLSVLIWGKFYLRKVNNRRGLPTRLEWLSPLDVSPITDFQTGEFRGFRVRGHDNIIPREQMIVALTFDPLNDFDGVSAYEVALRQIVGDRELMRFAQKYFQDGTMLGGMLTYEGDLGDEDYKRVKAEFEQFKGSQNAFRTFVAGGGLAKFDYKPMQPAPVDLAMTELKDILRADTCAAFGVNPVLIGVGDAKDPLSAQSTYDQIHDRFTIVHAVPRVRWIFEALNAQWLRPDFALWGDLRLEPDLSEITAVSKATPDRSTAAIGNAGRIWTLDEARDYTGRGKIPFPAIQLNPDWAIQAWQQGALQHGEYRAALGYKPDPTVQGYIWQVDPRASGQQSTLSFNVPHSAPPELPPSPPQRALPASTDALPVEIIPQTPIRADPITTKAMLYELDNWQKKIAHKGLTAAFEMKHLTDPVVSFVRSELAGLWNPKAVFAEARSAVRLGHEPRPLGATPEDAAAYWREFDGLQHDMAAAWLTYQRTVSERLFDAVLNQPGTVDLDKPFADAHGALLTAWIGTPDKPGDLSKLMLAGMQAGQRSLENEVAANPKKPRADLALAFDVNWHMASAQALDFVRSYSLNLITRIDDTTREGIRTAVDKYIAEGLSRDDLRDMIAQTLVPPGGEADAAIRARATLIGDSESMNAFRTGARNRWQNAGVQESEWMTVRDDKVCAVCRNLYHTRARIGEGFHSSVTGKTYTGLAHPGDRCFERPIT